MPKGRWKLSPEKVAEEAYLVLIKRQKASRNFPRARLVQFLAHPEARAAFLRLALEFDDSEGLVAFRKALLFAIQALGVSKVTKALGVNRVSLYRMLSPSGNPSLRYVTRMARYLGLRLWLVDEEFISRRKKIERPKTISRDLEAFEEWWSAELDEHGGPDSEEDGQ